MPSATWPVYFDPSHLYFITSSAIRRKWVFKRDVIRRILIDSLNTGRILGQYELYAFVIMPNHIHIIIRCINNYTPSDVVREYKKATANLIIRQFEVENDRQTLALLSGMVISPTKQNYAVWEAEYQAKNVFSPWFLRQKIRYIHNNPLQSHWNLATRPEDYVWSSARFYHLGVRALIPLSDAREYMI